MSDYNYRTFSHLGIAVPSECPFFPILKSNSSGQTTIIFNQAYVFDYQSKGDDGKIKKIKVQNMDQTYVLSQPRQFCVKINTDSESAKVVSAFFVDLSEGGEAAPDKFHYSSKNLDAPNVYVGGEGKFWIPVCNTDLNGRITDIFLRENIHWQKINFANTDKEENTNDEIKETFGVLYNWGDANTFSDNPTVKFSRLVQKTDDYNAIIDPEHVIKLERSPNNENIVITTQFPKLSQGKLSILERQIADEWNWVKADDSPNKDYLFIGGYSNGGNAMWLEMIPEGCIIYGTKGANPTVSLLPFPTDASSENIKILACDGENLFWQDDCCSTNIP